ncbi:hypothetical protein SCUCBS95973_009193 [Sporothrix curviconia]|uniref:Serine/threonineeeee-protein kinase ppk6 n=1 Tax=Sporothrix curviconia TaxID=1260050 RepID=A0ABP0CKU9_9PEZI
MDLISNTLINFGDTTSTAGALPPGGEPSSRPPQRDPWRNPEPEPTPKPRKPADPNVLFDAEDFEVNGASDDDDFDEDDFGDFESGHTSPPRPTAATTNLFTPQPPISQPATAKPIPTPAAATALIDLLSLSDPEPSATTPAFPMQPQPQAAPSVNRQAASLLSPLSFGSTAPATSQTPKSPSFQDRNPFPGLAVTTPLSGEFPIDKVRNRTPSPVTTWPSFEAPSTTSTAATKKAVPQPDEADWDAWDWDWEAEEPSQGADKRAPTALPPAIANAPIPNAIPDKAPPPTNPAEVRNRVIGNPKTIAFLRNYLQIIVVAGRVIAGRKQRWHRDKFLSQSMSISAAGSGKGGGMKLAGLDKAQGQREDREAADVVAAWIRHVGKLRTAVATANAALVAAEAAEHKHYQPLKVPELQSATIPVTVAKQVQTAIKPCIICGLRRDERVRGIDGDDVEDIFSEWWVEHWGHRVCRNFWAEHEAALRSR